MKEVIRDEEWWEMKKAIHRQAQEIKRINEEESKRGYTIRVVHEDTYRVDKEGFLI